jgi:hydroxymethylglutaryl-CoA reductase
MLEVESAEDLSRICAAVGLVQNLGALRALSTVGIIEGHMKLHIRNLTLGAGASEQEVPYVQRRLEEILAFKKRISLSQAVEVLKELRSKQPANANDY